MAKTQLRGDVSGAEKVGRRRRWVYNKPSLFLLLVLQPACLLLGFVLLTEPCLNAAFKPSLWDKRNYFAIIGALTRSAGREEWAERFGKAGVKSLFGTAVIQAWFTARITAYVEKAAQEERRLIALLKAKTAPSSAVAAQEGGDDKAVGSFVRQMESVSVSFLVLPLVAALVYGAIVLLGGPVHTHRKQTAVLATHLTLLIGLPLGHILGLPPIPELSTKSLLQASSIPQNTPASTEGKSAINTDKAWQTILSLDPRPSYLLPLFYPLLACIAATLLSTATLALDWDVAWQTYPFPQLVASFLGLALGNALTLYIILFR